MSAGSGAEGRRPGRWPDYRAVWRWHFYAGLFCIPFVIWLAITGSIYLWQPQVNAWLDQPYAHLLQPGRARLSPSAEVGAALRSQPGAALHAYQLPVTPDGAAQVLVGRGQGQVRVWVHPVTGAVAKSTPEDQRFMKVVFRLHGELLAGDKGSILVELAASWAIVMILTGVYLWWPRGAQGLAGTLYPRLHLRGRALWRDLHASTGLWVSAFALFLLLSGLPWAKSWGGNLQVVRAVAGRAMVRQDWTTGRSSELAERAALSRGSLAGQQAAKSDGEHGEHAGMHGTAAAMAPDPPDGYRALDRTVPTVAALALPAPVLVTPALREQGPWTARSDTPNTPRRVNLTLDPGTGAVLKRETFGQRNWLDQAIGVGIAAHEGQLFLGNQIISLLTAAGLLLIAVSGAMMWWRRRPDGVLGAPVPAGEPRFAVGLAAIVVVLGVLLPLLGASLVAVFLAERFVLRRMPGVNTWLGLRGAT